MRRLTLIGDDIRQLTQLAASLRGRYRSVTIVHTAQIVERAAEARDPERAVLVCLNRWEPEAGSLAGQPGLAFVLSRAEDFAALVAVGATCLRANASADEISSVFVTPDVRPRPIPRRARSWSSWPVSTRRAQATGLHRGARG